MTFHRIAPPAVLTGDRLFLRELEPRDADSIVDISVYDGRYAADPAEARAVLARIHADVARGESLHWGIFLPRAERRAKPEDEADLYNNRYSDEPRSRDEESPATNKKTQTLRHPFPFASLRARAAAQGDNVAGTIGFYRGFENETGEIGYILRPSFRGRGIMTEAVRLVVEYGLNTLKLQAILAYTDPDNSASIAVLERSGFRKMERTTETLKFVMLR